MEKWTLLSSLCVCSPLVQGAEAPKRPRIIGLRYTALGHNVWNFIRHKVQFWGLSREWDQCVCVFMLRRQSWLASHKNAKKGTASLPGCMANFTSEDLRTLHLTKRWNAWWTTWPWQSTQPLLHQRVIQRLVFVCPCRILWFQLLY